MLPKDQLENRSLDFFVTKFRIVQTCHDHSCSGSKIFQNKGIYEKFSQNIVFSILSLLHHAILLFSKTKTKTKG